MIWRLKPLTFNYFSLYVHRDETKRTLIRLLWRHADWLTGWLTRHFVKSLVPDPHPILHAPTVQTFRELSAWMLMHNGSIKWFIYILKCVVFFACCAFINGYVHTQTQIHSPWLFNCGGAPWICTMWLPPAYNLTNCINISIHLMDYNKVWVSPPHSLTLCVFHSPRVQYLSRGSLCVYIPEARLVWVQLWVHAVHGCLTNTAVGCIMSGAETLQWNCCRLCRWILCPYEWVPRKTQHCVWNLCVWILICLQVSALIECYNQHWLAQGSSTHFTLVSRRTHAHTHTQSTLVVQLEAGRRPHTLVPPHSLHDITQPGLSG